MSDVLQTICDHKREHVAARKALISLNDLEQKALAASPVRDFTNGLAQAAEKDYGLICEIKRGSPSKGLIREDFDPAGLARAYEAGGAACLSVLTDERWFMGHDDFLAMARDQVSLPVLRKDFMVEPYQIVESRALGADCILIIMAALSDAQARELEDTALSLGLHVLVEVHDEAEMDRALENLASPLLGVNNRNLKTLEVSLETSLRLAAMVPKGKMLIGESGLSSRADLNRLAEAGIRRFLIGESLMRQYDVEAATRALLTPA